MSPKKPEKHTLIVTLPYSKWQKFKALCAEDGVDPVVKVRAIIIEHVQSQYLARNPRAYRAAMRKLDAKLETLFDQLARERKAS